MGNNLVPAKMATLGSAHSSVPSGPQHPSLTLPSEYYKNLPHPLPVELRHTPVLAMQYTQQTKGFILLGAVSTTIICAVCPTLRCVWEVSFAITSNSSSIATKHMWKSRICYHTLLRPNTMTWLVHAVLNILVAPFRDSKSIDACALPEVNSMLSEQPATLLQCTCCIHLQASQHIPSVCGAQSVSWNLTIQIPQVGLCKRWSKHT